MNLFGIPLNTKGTSQANWEASMTQPVKLSRIASEVSATDAKRLQEAHPTGEALIWGYHRDLDVQPGDIVVFAGGKSVHHVGRVGVPFTCEGLDSIWESPHGNPYKYAYTVDALIDTSNSLSFDDFDALREKKTGIWRMPVKFGEFENSVMADFLHEEVLNLDRVLPLSVSTADDQSVELGTSANGESGDSYGSIRQQTAQSTTASIKAAERTMTFEEIALVDRFSKHCEERGGIVGRLRNSSAETDAVAELDGKRILVEAKTTADPDKVYTAIGQLGHYGSIFRTHDFTDRAFLASGDIKNKDLHTTLFEHGIDVILENPDGSFTWHEAPEVYKDAWRNRPALSSVASTESVESAPSHETAAVGQQASQESLAGFKASSKQASRLSLGAASNVVGVPGVVRGASQTSYRDMGL